MPARAERAVTLPVVFKNSRREAPVTGLEDSFINVVSRRARQRVNSQNISRGTTPGAVPGSAKNASGKLLIPWRLQNYSFGFSLKLAARGFGATVDEALDLMRRTVDAISTLPRRRFHRLH